MYGDKCKKGNCVDDWEFTIEALEKNTDMSPLKFDEIWFVSSRKEVKNKNDKNDGLLNENANQELIIW